MALVAETRDMKLKASGLHAMAWAGPGKLQEHGMASHSPCTDPRDLLA